MGKILKKLNDMRKEDLRRTAMARGDYPAYCIDCKRSVTPRGVSIWGFIALLLLGLIFTPFFIGIFLILIAFFYYAKYYKRGGRCPICNGRNLRFDKI